MQSSDKTKECADYNRKKSLHDGFLDVLGAFGSRRCLVGILNCPWSSSMELSNPAKLPPPKKNLSNFIHFIHGLQRGKRSSKIIYYLWRG